MRTRISVSFWIKPTDALNSQIYFVKKLCMFRAVPLPIIRSLPLYIRHWYMSYRFDDSFQARPSWSCVKAVIKHIPVPNLQWKTLDDGQTNCPKHAEFLDKNKFGKLVRLLVLLKRNRKDCSSVYILISLLFWYCLWMYSVFGINFEDSCRPYFRLVVWRNGGRSG